jgi:mono/diheme cytochrome c family protein
MFIKSACHFGVSACVVVVFMSGSGTQTSNAQSVSDAIKAENAKGWRIPDAAATEKSPLSPTPKVLNQGKGLFKTHCQKCHGPDGKGKGADAEREHPPADLTASRLADGIMFYKVWNGRSAPTMTVFKSKMTKEEVWTVIEYAKSLRQGSDLP